MRILILVLFLCFNGCGWYTDGEYDSDYDYDYDNPTIDEICTDKCFTQCDNCYYYDYSVKDCTRYCEPKCRSYGCYKSYQQTSCDELFQDVCNGQFE